MEPEPQQLCWLEVGAHTARCNSVVESRVPSTDLGRQVDVVAGVMGSSLLLLPFCQLRQSKGGVCGRLRRVGE
jgi:hypothetical protein